MAFRCKDSAPGNSAHQNNGVRLFLFKIANTETPSARFAHYEMKTERNAMRVHYFQHVSFEGPGYIGTWLKKHGHAVTCTHFFEPSYSMPSAEDADVFIVMGGPMGVYDEAIHPWLAAEKTLLKTAIAKGKKLLGICLGAQLLAECLGAKVQQAPHKEIGWFPVHVTEEAMKVPWFETLFPSGITVFHWHGDQFAIPAGAHDLAFSSANRNQAFLYKNQVLGLQFHLEVTGETLSAMVTNGRAELDENMYIQNAEQIMQQSAACISCNKLMSDLLERFLGPEP